MNALERTALRPLFFEPTVPWLGWKDIAGVQHRVNSLDLPQGTAASSVTYIRDATDQVIRMTTTGASTNDVRYSTGAGLQFTLNAGLSAVNETTMSLPGGVSVSIRSASQVWSFPNLHGDNVVTTLATGTRTGTIAIYDPFGAMSKAVASESKSIDGFIGDFGYANGERSW